MNESNRDQQIIRKVGFYNQYKTEKTKKHFSTSGVYYSHSDFKKLKFKQIMPHHKGAVDENIDLNNISRSFKN